MIMKKLEDSYFQKLPKIFATTSLQAINKDCRVGDWRFSTVETGSPALRHRRR